MQARIRFQVEDIFPYQDGWALAGRCTEGPVRAGDIFSLVGSTAAAGLDKSNDDGVAAALSIEVVSIEWFNQKIPELWVGHAGGLHVRGEGVDQLRRGCEIEGY